MTPEPSAETESAPFIFGTDGIRARAGEGILADDGVRRVVAATARVLRSSRVEAEAFADRSRSAGGVVVVGRDTRGSGAGLLALVVREFARRGFDVIDVGVLPTPGVAFAGASLEGVVLSVMLSASHNPAEYNGIKFFTPAGAKVSESFEQAVSAAFHRGDDLSRAVDGEIVDRAEHAFESYVGHLVGRCRRPARILGAHVALDAANGAGFRVAPEVFRRLGAVVTAVGVEPDGTNINADCGALFAENLAGVVRSTGAAIGFCLDGDGDRMVPIGASGTVFDGDHVLYLAALALHASGALAADTVVATSMSNFGLEQALREHGLRLVRTDVGDRNVYLEMEREGYVLGGEQSGHTIFLDDARTGDGILSALRLVDSLAGDDLDLEGEVSRVRRYPQVIENVRVREKVPLESLPEVAHAMEAARAALEGRGRIVLRYSGTEPLARVMVESDQAETTSRVAREVARVIADALGE